MNTPLFLKERRGLRLNFLPLACVGERNIHLNEVEARRDARGTA